MDKKLPKGEIISSSRNIGDLISRPDGVSSAYPLKLYWREDSRGNDPLVKVAFLVSRKNFKKAVVRNLIKRRMRAAYRNNKQELIKSCSANNIPLDILFLYGARKVVSYADVQSALHKLLHTLAIQISGKDIDA